MAATSKGSKSVTKAATPANKTRAGSGKGATRNTQAAPAGNGADPGTPKTRAAAPKKAAPVKLTDKQRDFLKKIADAGATGGYEAANKNELRSVESLAEKKLLKRGTKNKEKGVYRYLLTKAGEKYLSPAPQATPAP